MFHLSSSFFFLNILLNIYVHRSLYSIYKTIYQRFSFQTVHKLELMFLNSITSTFIEILKKKIFIYDSILFIFYFPLYQKSYYSMQQIPSTCGNIFLYIIARNIPLLMANKNTQVCTYFESLTCSHHKRVCFIKFQNECEQGFIYSVCRQVYTYNKGYLPMYILYIYFYKYIM